MEPDGDPEARIRELERSLSETARRSELGVTNPSPYPPQTSSPYPPPLYGTPYPTRSPAPKFLRRFMVFFAVITAGVAGLIFYAAKPTAPHNVPTGSGPSATRPARSTVVKLPTRTSATPSTTSTPGPTYAPPGSTFSVSGTHKQITVNCDDCSVSVSGVSNTVDIVGNCDTLTVSGVENTVTVEAARTIGASGFDNKVTYHSGEPEVSKSGDNNTVEQG
ncbi:DUF3060 domain-containing protein [Mycobacteroides salmoniphilum]|uniref:DUF3060 domain-containing protein n=1 Tax=Mycobacteroides salmoniphilum TaxID=404941 RepID=UPI0009934B05|nr:DUF3060 domain-containing protein [Mycobacteroides salmoniphilum]